MYPTRELTELAERKRLLQARIGLGRLQSMATAQELARPIAILDRGIEFFRRIAPFAKLLAVPAGLLLGRSLTRRSPVSGGRRRGGKIGTVLAFLPMIVRGAKWVWGVRGARAAKKAAGGAAQRP
jgi:hypothetical protein